MVRIDGTHAPHSLKVRFLQIMDVNINISTTH